MLWMLLRVAHVSACRPAVIIDMPHNQNTVVTVCLHAFDAAMQQLPEPAEPLHVFYLYSLRWAQV